MRRINDAGKALIKEFEGYSDIAYQDAAGIWTIGYGHTSQAGPPEVTPGSYITHDRSAALSPLARFFNWLGGLLG